MTIFQGYPRGADRTFALVCSRFNDLIVTRLEHGARDTLVRHGTDNDNIDTIWVPGALEIPIVVKALADTGRYNGIIALGAVMRGATYHFEIVANNSASALAHLAIDTGIVITNGILTVDTMEQALERAGSKAGNKGADAALAALETIDILHRLHTL